MRLEEWRGWNVWPMNNDKQSGICRILVSWAMGNASGNSGLWTGAWRRSTRSQQGCLQSGRWRLRPKPSQELTAKETNIQPYIFTSPSPFFKTVIRVRLLCVRFEFLKCFMLDENLNNVTVEAWHKESSSQHWYWSLWCTPLWIDSQTLSPFLWFI